MTLIDDFLPEFDFHEVHRRQVAGTAAAALAAAKAAGPEEMPFVRTLFALRSLAASGRGRGLPRSKGRPLAEQMVEFGFVVLAESEREIVLGFVGQPWKLSGGSMPRLRSAEDWRAFAEPGYVKAAMNFLSSDGLLETETRIRATDAVSRLRFARYWRVIRPGSGLIRRSWLRAAGRRLSAA